MAEEQAQAQTDEQYSSLSEKSNDVVVVSTFLSSDRLKLFIDVQRKPPEVDDKGQKKFPRQVNKDDIISLLPDIPANQLDTSVIEYTVKLLNDGKSVEKRRVAKGVPPIHGEDGRLVLLVKKYVPAHEAKERETKDLRHIHAFDNITENMQVGRILAPTDGKDGFDAIGKTIKASNGKKARVMVDKTIQVLPNTGPEQYEMLIAKSEGYLSEDSGKVRIVNELSIDGDVDFVTGSLDFIGSIKVSGNVMKGFSVIAKGDITIAGDVEEAYIESLNGSISVGGSVVGYFVPPEVLARDRIKRKIEGGLEKPNIKAKINLKAFRIQQAVAEVEGNIEVDKEVMNCTLRSRKSILLSKGQILGGTFNAAHGVEARLIGSSGGSRTCINLCGEVESSSDYAGLIQAINSHKQAGDLLRSQIGPYVQDIEALKKLPEMQKRKIIGLLGKLNNIENELAILEKERQAMLESGVQVKQIRVNFFIRMFKGTEITASGQLFDVEEDHGGPKSLVYLTDKQEFRFSDLKALDFEETFPEDSESQQTTSETRNTTEQT